MNSKMMLQLQTHFINRAGLLTIKLEQKMVSAAIPLIAYTFLSISPCFANDPSPFVVDGQTGGEQTAPKLSTAKEYYVRALNESNNKDFPSSVRDYTEALRLDPHYGEALGNRGAAKFNLQDYNGALSDYNAALKIFPGNKALLGLKSQVETTMQENANQSSQNAQLEARKRALMLNQAMLGGDFADPSTMIMRNAQQRGLIPNVGDPGDPATIIMNNARRRGLIPANTPNP
jgi:tetratricopeptide (TPR) repeat protein